MNITIHTTSVYDYALALTARVGKMSENYANVALTEDNYPMLDVYLSSGVAHAEGELRRKLADSNSFDLKVMEDSVVISLDNATRRDPSVLSLAETSIRLFLGYYIAAEWLRPTAAGVLSEVYGTTAATHLQTAVNALNQRKIWSADPEDYKRRNKDYLTARNAPRIIEGEILRVRTKDGRMEIARTFVGENLTSNT